MSIVPTTYADLISIRKSALTFRNSNLYTFY
jgi:hypothetical protein